jgi:hypothetical protein
MKTVSYSEFCWNGDHTNCQIWLADTATGKPVRACRTKVQAGMKTVKMSDGIKLEK